MADKSGGMSKSRARKRHWYGRCVSDPLLRLEDTLMQYVMLIYESPADFESRQPPESEPYVAAWRAYYSALVEAGVYVSGGGPLKSPETGTTIRVEDGRRYVQDGPFAEAKAQLGGFVVLDLPSLDDALEWAARCPVAATGAVEVRPMDVAWYEAIVAG